MRLYLVLFAVVMLWPIFIANALFSMTATQIIITIFVLLASGYGLYAFDAVAVDGFLGQYGVFFVIAIVFVGIILLCIKQIFQSRRLVSLDWSGNLSDERFRRWCAAYLRRHGVTLTRASVKQFFEFTAQCGDHKFLMRTYANELTLSQMNDVAQYCQRKNMRGNPLVLVTQRSPKFEAMERGIRIGDKIRIVNYKDLCRLRDILSGMGT